MPTYVIETERGRTFLKGELGPHCRTCAAPGDSFLCDFPMPKGRTCDAHLCEQCATEIAPDTHYCKAHLAEWQRFEASGGVRRRLENVVPYKKG